MDSLLFALSGVVLLLGILEFELVGRFLVHGPGDLVHPAGGEDITCFDRYAGNMDLFHTPPNLAVPGTIGIVDAVCLYLANLKFLGRVFESEYDLFNHLLSLPF